MITESHGTAFVILYEPVPMGLTVAQSNFPSASSLAVDQIPDGKMAFGPDKNSSAVGKGFF